MKKVCTRCKVEKEESDFHFRSKGESRQSWCKQCTKDYMRERQQKIREHNKSQTPVAGATS